MRNYPLRALLGAALVILGVLLLTNTLGGDPPLREVALSGAVITLGVAALGLFGFSGRWWLLALGCALATAGALQILNAVGLDQFFTVSGVSLIGLGGTFVGLYLRRHEQWGWLIPGYTLWVMGAVFLVVGLALIGPPLTFGWIVTLTLWLFALLLLVVFMGNRGAWWAFVPAYGLWAIGAILRLLAGRVTPGGLATWGLWALALLFWLGYLRNDTRLRGLLLAGGLSVAGALPLFLTPQLGFWLAIGVSVGVGLAWGAAWLRRREPDYS